MVEYHRLWSRLSLATIDRTFLLLKSGHAGSMLVRILDLVQLFLHEALILRQITLLFG